jgi:hypothetical protein
MVIWEVRHGKKLISLKSVYVLENLIFSINIPCKLIEECIKYG